VKAKRVMAISIQTEETVVIRKGKAEASATCPQCGGAAPMITPEQAAVSLSLPIRAIYRAIEAGCLHYQETSQGLVTVCLSSLRKAPLLLSGKTSPQIKQ